MARKERDSVAAGMDDLLGSIVASDRRRSGRGAATEAVTETAMAPEGIPSLPTEDPGANYDNKTSVKEIRHYDNKTNRQTIGQTDVRTNNRTDGQTIGQTDKQTLSHEDNTALSKPNNKTTKQDDIMTTTQVIESSVAGRTARREGTSASKVPATGRGDTDRKRLLRGRAEDAQRRSTSPTMTVTLRIPRELNDWLDEYAHLSWPERVKKQDLVVEALRLVIARRGRPGDEVVDTDLLGEG